MLAGSENEGGGTVVSATAPQLEVEPLPQAGERPLSVASSSVSTDLRVLPSDSSEMAKPEKEVRMNMLQMILDQQNRLDNIEVRMNMLQMILDQQNRLDNILVMLAKPTQVVTEKATSSTQQVVEAMTAEADREWVGSFENNDDESP